MRAENLSRRHRRMALRTLAGLAGGWLLAGCASPVRTALEPPEVPASFKEAGPFRPASLVTPVPDAWWRLFQDPVLDQLQEQLIPGNENLKSSIAQYRAALAALASSRSALFPSLGLSASALRSSTPPLQVPLNADSLAMSASWELDLWGRLGAQAEASRTRADASQADLASVRLSLQAALTQTYFFMRAAEAQAIFLDRSVATFTRSLQLTRDRYEAGVASAADVAQAESQLKATQAQRVEAHTSRAQLEHALAVLLGKAPAAFSTPVTGKLPPLPEVPAQLPSQLLQRRPDIAAAANRVAAAQLQLGAARAAFFPAVTLSASGGYRSDTLAHLLSAPHLFWSIGPAAALAVFDGGARRAAVDAAVASAEQATASYRQTLLIALQEVEDNLASVSGLQQQTALLEQSLSAAQRALRISEDQYKAGTVSYLSVLTAQTTVLAVERNLLDARTRALSSSSQLLKNIAGRWDGPISPPSAA